MKHNLVIDFSQGVAYSSKTPTLKLKLKHSGDKSNVCKMLTLDDELPQAIPTALKNADIPSFDMPTDVHPACQQLIENHTELSSQHLGKTSVTSHVIDTGDASPVRVPPCPILFRHAVKVHRQLKKWQVMVSFNRVIALGVPRLYTYPKVMESLGAAWTLSN